MARRARIYLRGVEEQVEKWRIGVDVGARKYQRVVRELSADEYSRVADELTKVRRAARDCARKLGWPTARWAHAIAVANRAWKLAKLGVPDAQYEAELNATIVALGLRREDVAKLLQCMREKGVEVKPLPGRR